MFLNFPYILANIRGITHFPVKHVLLSVVLCCGCVGALGAGCCSAVSCPAAALRFLFSSCTGPRKDYLVLVGDSSVPLPVFLNVPSASLQQVC